MKPTSRKPVQPLRLLIVALVGVVAAIAAFAIVIASSIHVGVGDSGGAVLVRGIPAGVSSRNFGGFHGFTPLAEGLAQLGLELCTTPDCGLTAPATNEP